MSKAQQSIQALVMAAGKGTRLKSDLPKVLHPLFGKPLLQHVLQTLNGLVGSATVVVGHQADSVTETMQTWSLDYAVRSVLQSPQNGTGHAVQVAKGDPKSTLSGSVLILYGDVPLMTKETLSQFVETHRQHDSAITLMVAEMENPYGYGRVIAHDGQVKRVVEEKDATEEERRIHTVNTGIYCVDWEHVAPLVDKLTNDNAQSEYYLTDLIALADEAKLQVRMVLLRDASEIIGVNSRLDLSVCHEVLNQRQLAACLENGVSVMHPSSTMIGPDVVIEPDTVIYPNCFIEGNVHIAKGCTIGPNTTIRTTTNAAVSIGPHSRVFESYVTDTNIGEHSSVGPYAHLRDDVTIADHVKIGNFVEMKNAKVGSHSFASHLAYIGDAELGSDVNMGAGTITANFDPIRGTKDKTIIEDKVKVGCNSVLVAPVTVKEGACVAAGSVITKDVSAWDLAIARCKQSTVAGWVKKVLKNP